MGAQTRKTTADTQSLAARLAARIRAHGPLSVADYMQACLSDAREGVYAVREPIGAAGDFITAPEISQIFGELLGLWCIAIWQSMGEPPAITVAELGPGRGTLMADALRAWRSVPTFLASVSVALIESSPILRATQRKALHASTVPLRWHTDLDALPAGPLIVLANEFLDALPIHQHQYVRRDSTWHERVVSLDAHGHFDFAAGDAVHLDGTPPEAPDGAIFETRPAATTLLAALGARAADAPLAALFIDYGHEEMGLGDTLQAVAAHNYADPLAAPGGADLSAHVDFAALKRDAVRFGLRPYGPMPQGEFLLRLGLAARRDRLLAGAAPSQRAAIASATARLIDPRQMGMLFKAIALTSAGLPAPPPFAASI
jgi:NADH dehydrogenase [ubiquinone] 1 alpha subcomplex assembly factor 7